MARDMAEQPRGKSGTIRIDPSSTIPEAGPVRFADDLDASDKQDLALAPTAPVTGVAKPIQPTSDRQEYETAGVSRGRSVTFELRTVDVSKADPRHAPTQQALRGLKFDPTLGRIVEEGVIEDPSAPPPVQSQRWKLILTVAVGVSVVAMIALWLVFRR